MAKIELKAIRKAFDSTEILKGIDLAIEDGEFIALIGPSGCGKSTLLRVMAGLEPQTSGEVRIGDVAVAPVLAQQGGSAPQVLDRLARPIDGQVGGKEPAPVDGCTLAQV